MLRLKYEEYMNWINLAQVFCEHVSGTSFSTGITDYKFLSQINSCLFLRKELRH